MKFLAITFAVAQLLAAPCVQASNGYANDKNAPAAVDPDHCGSPAKHACSSHGGADCVAARPATADADAARQQIELLAIYAALDHGTSFSIVNVLHDPPEKSTREVKFAWRRAAVSQEVCGDL
jgi:hypothetical protein